MLKVHLQARLVKSLALPASVAAGAAPTTATGALEEIGASRRGLARVVLKKGKTQLFRDGNPMVYSGAVDRIIGRPPPKTGDAVLVADGSEKPIGWGLYNSVSMFCVRLMQLEEEVARDPCCVLNMDKLIEARMVEAIELRRSMGLPSMDTDAFRLVNSEGDRLSGLIVDIFGNVAVVASSAAWVEKYRAEIELCIRKISGIEHVRWRPSIEILKEEGLNILDESDPSSSDISGTVKVKENGIRYSISLEGQKTGFYADQRESRQLITSISKGKRVLDICCYSGGFALNSARGGAIDVIGVDSSLPALELARENIVLNEMDPSRISFVKEDATAFMKGGCFKAGIMGPCDLGSSKTGTPEEGPSKCFRDVQKPQLPGYEDHKAGWSTHDMFLFGAMTQSGIFLNILQNAASMAGRKITVLRQAGAACDHPIDPSYPEGAYLSNVLLRVQ